MRVSEEGWCICLLPDAAKQVYRVLYPIDPGIYLIDLRQLSPREPDGAFALTRLDASNVQLVGFALVIAGMPFIKKLLLTRCAARKNLCIENHRLSALSRSAAFLASSVAANSPKVFQHAQSR
jgi:hypothetical protein